MSREEIMQKAIDSILEIDEDMAVEALEAGKGEGISSVEILQEGFAKGLADLGDMFAAGDVFLPELIFAGEVMSVVSEAVDAEIQRIRST